MTTGLVPHMHVRLTDWHRDNSLAIGTLHKVLMALTNAADHLGVTHIGDRLSWAAFTIQDLPTTQYPVNVFDVYNAIDDLVMLGELTWDRTYGTCTFPQYPGTGATGRKE